jgi:hypothetical protein
LDDSLVNSPQPTTLLIRKGKAPPALTNAYQKAHKSYVLASALFASWVLIGFGLDTKDRWGLEIKSPNGIPLVLLTMIFYFGYRLTIEWMQCDEERRSMRVAKVDFVTAHVIAGVALSIGLIQYLSHVRVADYAATRPSRVAVWAVSSVNLVIALNTALMILVKTQGSKQGMRLVPMQIARDRKVELSFVLFVIGVLLLMMPIYFWGVIAYLIVCFVTNAVLYWPHKQPFDEKVVGHKADRT